MQNWKGGISFEPYNINWTDDLKESIRKRDNYVCQLCGIHQDELKWKLCCHHIDYNKDNLDPINLITLCINCHCKTNYNRDYWVKYFMPLTQKGNKIMNAMKKEYGSKKGKEVFYASQNKGIIKGTHKISGKKK